MSYWTAVASYNHSYNWGLANTSCCQFAGAVVGGDFCNQESLPVTNSSFWTFITGNTLR